MNDHLQDAVAIMERTRKDPEWWVDEVLNDRPWSGQVEVMESVRDHRITCVPSCHAGGKDWIAARVGLWFAMAHLPSKVITTAPTDRQVRLILWSEINTAYAGSRFPLGGRILQQELKLAADHFMIGFASPDYDPDKFQGFHSPHILVILDEAAGISSEVRDGVSGLMASGLIVRLLQIGNPTDADCVFAKDCRRPGINTIRISAFDTPNFTEFDLQPEDFDNDTWREKIDGRPLPTPYLVSPEWVAEKLADVNGDWTDPFVISRILAIFPEDNVRSLIKQFDLQASLDRDLNDDGLPVELSCDVAREGDDDTKIGIRRGWKYRKLATGRGWSITETAGALIDAYDREGATNIKVDDDGLGGGVVDILREQRYPVVALHGGSNANLPRRFQNARAEWHWNTRTLLADGQLDLDSADEDLIQQLGQLRTRGFDSQGRRRIEKKEDYKKRVGRSPDDADCCIYAFAEPRVSKSKMGPRIRGG